MFGQGFLDCPRQEPAGEGAAPEMNGSGAGRQLGALLVGLVLALASLPVNAGGAEPRDLFRQAISALTDEPERYPELKRQLRDYPLYPYLEYEELLASLDSAAPEAVHRFVARYRGKVPLTEGLQQIWLRRLAAAGRWKEYIAEYRRGMGAEFDCLLASARLNSGHEAEAWPLIQSLWLVGEPQPPACDGPFQAWRESGRMTPSLIMRRIGKALYRDEVELARYLTDFLPPTRRSRAERWIAVHEDPAESLRSLAGEEHSFWTALFFRYAVVALARRDAAAAARIWESDAGKYAYSKARRRRIERTITFNLAYQHEPAAFDRLTRLAERGDRVAREWLLRLSIWHGRWGDVLTRIAALPAQTRREPEWLYWRARALERLGKPDAARKAYQRASDCRCYYGYMAAERLGEPHSVGTRPLKVAPEELEALRRLPALVRIEELRALGRDADARREWSWFAPQLPAARLDAAALLAHRYGWPDRVIFALGRSGRVGDLELRYPTPYAASVEREASRQGLDKILVYSLMRQESAFWPNARSRVGALGVMQLMPDTAKESARRLGLPEPSAGSLLKPMQNIRIGVGHLGELVRRYGGNWIYALAAYNAGHHRVVAWQPKNGAVPADVWIANIPFAETREYVQRIIVYTRIYSWRFGRDWTMRSAFLGNVRPLTQVASTSE